MFFQGELIFDGIAQCANRGHHEPGLYAADCAPVSYFEDGCVCKDRRRFRRAVKNIARGTVHVLSEALQRYKATGEHRGAE